MVKARMLAGAYGIKKVHNEQELWDRINFLGDEQTFYLIEKFIPGNIYHVDTIIYEREIKFACASRYGTPPFEVAHNGRVFSSLTLDNSSEEAIEVLKLNNRLLKALGLVRGVSHSEFIRDENGKFYFLETSARVGGANLSVLVEAATGINLWREWAKIEILKGDSDYKLPELKNNYAAIVTSLAKQQVPDLSSFTDKEIFWKLNKEYHAGLVVSSPDKERTIQLCDDYTKRFYKDFFATAQMGEKPVN
jgi:biotin carboxylase